MKNKVFTLVLAMVILASALSLVSCREADRVSYNISKQADNFNVVRRITVINCIQGDVLFVMEGKMSIEDTGTQLSVIVANDDGTYKKHIVGLSDNVTYTLEDLSCNYVDAYRYNIWFNPKMWLPVEIKPMD